MRTAIRGLAAAAFAVVPASAGHAQSPAEFYRGKTVDLHIAYSVGGGYDLYARLIARHLGKHIPGNPKVVPKNMEGAGGMRARQLALRRGAKDGTVLGGDQPRHGVRAAARQQVRAIRLRPSSPGSAAPTTRSASAWRGTRPASRRSRTCRQRQLVVGSGGTADDTYQFPAILNNMFGAKFKMVTGYAGGTEINIAMERGEVQGRCGFPWSTVKASHQHWMREKKLQPADAVLARQARRPAGRAAGDGPRQAPTSSGRSYS